MSNKLPTAGCVIMGLLLQVSRCPADPIASFLTAYPDKAAALQKEYSNVSFKAERSLTQAKGVKDPSKVVESADVFLNGEKFRSSSLCLSSTNPAVPADTLTVAGGDSELFFHVYRKPKSSDFVFYAYGKAADFQSKLRYSYCRPAFAPFCVTDESVVEIFSGKRFVVKSTTSETRDGEAVVRVRLDCVDPTMPTKWADLTFDPDTGCVMGYRVSFGTDQIVGRNLYDPAHKIHIRRVEAWKEDANGSVSQIINLDVSDLKFGAVSDDQLTPQSAGLKELPAIQSK